MALVVFGPVAIDGTLWSAWWGDGAAFLAELERPSVAMQANTPQTNPTPTP
jgi:hypothetical protein